MAELPPSQCPWLFPLPRSLSWLRRTHRFTPCGGFRRIPARPTGRGAPCGSRCGSIAYLGRPVSRRRAGGRVGWGCFSAWLLPTRAGRASRLVPFTSLPILSKGSVRAGWPFPACNRPCGRLQRGAPAFPWARLTRPSRGGCRPPRAGSPSSRDHPTSGEGSWTRGEWTFGRDGHPSRSPQGSTACAAAPLGGLLLRRVPRRGTALIDPCGPPSSVVSEGAAVFKALLRVEVSDPKSLLTRSGTSPSSCSPWAYSPSRFCSLPLGPASLLCLVPPFLSSLLGSGDGRSRWPVCWTGGAGRPDVAVRAPSARVPPGSLAHPASVRGLPPRSRGGGSPSFRIPTFGRKWKEVRSCRGLPTGRHHHLAVGGCRSPGPSDPRRHFLRRGL